MSILAYCALLAYILVGWIFGGFLALIVCAGMLVAPCIIAKKSKFLQYHLSMIFPALLGVMVVNVVEGFLSAKLYWFVYSTILTGTWNEFAAGFVAVILAWFVHIIFMAVPVLILIAGLVNAIKGKAKDLPLVGGFKFTFTK